MYLLYLLENLLFLSKILIIFLQFTAHRKNDNLII